MPGLPGDPSSNDSQKDSVITALVFHKTMSSFVLFFRWSAAGAELHWLPDVYRWMNSCILLGKNMQQPLLFVFFFLTAKQGLLSYSQEACQLYRTLPTPSPSPCPLLLSLAVFLSPSQGLFCLALTPPTACPGPSFPCSDMEKKKRRLPGSWAILVLLVWCLCPLVPASLLKLPSHDWPPNSFIYSISASRRSFLLDHMLRPSPSLGEDPWLQKVPCLIFLLSQREFVPGTSSCLRSSHLCLTQVAFPPAAKPHSEQLCCLRQHSEVSR